MAEPAKKLEIISGSKKSEDILETIKNRRLSELVFGFCGALGAGVSTVAEKLENRLGEYGYVVIKIKISDLLLGKFDKYKKEIGCDKTIEELKANKNIRGEALQDLGDYLRREKGNGILAQLVVKKIALMRAEVYENVGEKLYITNEETGDEEININPNVRIAWFVDSFKNPEEVEVFRHIYRNIFYLIGVLCPKDLRAQRLESKGITRIDASKMIERDQSEAEESGQQLIKTIHLSDCFINNSHTNIINAEKALSRFLSIIFGENISPTKAEYAMYVAYSAALKSSCLSRQVGAAIVDTDGEVIATGTNDVPKAGGGLYCYEDLENDSRCLNMWNCACSNDLGKADIEAEINKKLLEKNIENSVNFAAEIVKGTKIKGLTEYCRAVHAEMDAIVSAARKPNVGTVGADMYVTTFPCHNCARHIVAAGIKRVFYIEPYEKSLALKLHNDSISTEDKSGNVVCFLPFQGVAPRQYQNLFAIHADRKVNGKASKIDSKTAKPVNDMLIDRYFDYENKVVKYLESSL